MRLGLTHALWTMVVAAMRRAMGLRRPWHTKIMPWLLAVTPYAPVGYLLAVQANLGTALDPALLPSPRFYARFYALIALPLVLFAGLVAPDLLCPDRRERVLSLYFVAPITRLHYVGAKVGAVFSLLLLLSLAPALLLFTGNAFLANDTASFVRHHLADGGHIVLGGLLLALYYSALAMAVAGFNDRRAYASGSFVGLLLVSSVSAGILAQGMTFAGHERFALLNLLRLPVLSVDWIFGQRLQPNLDGWDYLGATLGVIAASLALLSWQYLRLRE